MTDSLVLEIGLIEADEELQPRVKTDRNVSQTYGLAMARGAVFPPVDVFFDGETYWLADGFHRYDAHVALGLKLIDCIVHQGSYADALWFTCSANATNGLHRTRDDVRFSIRRALLHPKSAGWSDGRISGHVGCSPKTVGAVRAEMVATREIPELNVRLGKDGKVRDVTDIGASPPQLAELPKATVDEPGPELGPLPNEPEPDEDEPEESSRMDIEEVPGVKTAGKVVPLIDPKWEHLPSNISAIVRAHANLPHPGVAAQNFPECLGHSLDIADVEAIAKWWTGFLPLWHARQPELKRYLDRITAPR
jgi:hypothetical protein